MTSHDASKVERLLRSLVGVADLHLVWKTERSLSATHILRESGTQQHQLVRNVVSALHAGFGIRVDPAHVHVHDDAAAFNAVPREPVASLPKEKPVNASSDVVKPAIAAAPPSPPPAAPRVVNARPAAPRTAAQPVRAAREREDVPMTLHHIDVERHAGSLRCKVVLAQGERTFAAIAETADAPAAEAELAARVTLDALRAGGFTNGFLDGVGFLTISDTNYVTVAIRERAADPPRVSGAPMIDSMAWSAAAAVLRAVGPLSENDSPVPARLPQRSR